MEEIVNDINAILDGKMKADKACEGAQQWLRVTCYMYAKEVAMKSTKQERRAALELVKEREPLFYDDVERLAKMIYSATKAH